MAHTLHLLKADAPPLAPAAIARTAAVPGAEVTVVLLDAVPAPALPPSVPVHRLGVDLDHAGLLELVFAADHVIAW